MEETMYSSRIINYEDYPNIQYQIKGQDTKEYKFNICHDEKTIKFIINEINDILNFEYKCEFTLQELHYLNRLFRQYISLDELFNLFFQNLKEEEIIINKQDKNIKLTLLIEFRGNKEEIIFIFQPTCIHYEEAIIKLNEKFKNVELLFNEEKNENNKKIKILEEKLEKKDLIINNLIERINLLEKLITKITKSNCGIDSVIIKNDEYNLIEEGIRHNFNKSIINYDLLIRGSRDGFKSKDFHEKCDNQSFTVTFVETTEGKRFGGFTEEVWDQSDSWKKDPKSFIFSLDNKEIYFCKEGKNAICCYPKEDKNFLGFGEGHDFKLYENCNKNFICYDNSGNSFDTNGKEYALAGTNHFTVKDYEVHKINLI